jgi:hypothetical protein
VYNTVVSGTAITATWGNQVRDQEVSVFASAAARDSAITSPVSGMYATTTDTGFLWRYNGSKWMRGPETVMKTADEQRASTTTLTNDAVLAITGDANSKYAFTAYFLVIGTIAIGCKIGLTYPGDARADYGRTGQQTGGGGTFFNDSLQNAASGSNGIFGSAGAGNFATVQYHGMIAFVSAGTMNVQFAQGTSNASASWMLQGSHIDYRQVA